MIIYKEFLKSKNLQSASITVPVIPTNVSFVIEIVPLAMNNRKICSSSVDWNGTNRLQDTSSLSELGKVFATSGISTIDKRHRATGCLADT